MSGNCSEVADISSSQAFKGVLLAKACLSFIGIAAPIILLRLKGIRWLTHPNAKVLFCFHIFCTFQVNFVNFTTLIFNYWRLSRPVANPCDRMLTIGFCMATKMPLVVGFVSEGNSMLAFALERAYSTLYPSSYEKIKSPALSIFLCLLSLISASALKCGLMLPGLDFSELTPSYSYVFPGNAKNFQTSLEWEMIIESCTGIIFAAAYFRNRQLKKQQQVFDTSILAAKYQVTENQRLIEMLFPLFVLHFFINMFVVAILAAFPFFFAENSVTRMIWSECWSMPWVYGTLVPIIVFIRLEKQNQRKKELSGMNQTTKEYFDHMATLFK